MIQLLISYNCDPSKKNKKRQSCFELCPSDTELMTFIHQLYSKQKADQSKSIQIAIETPSTLHQIPHKENLVDDFKTSSFNEVMGQLDKSANLSKHHNTDSNKEANDPKTNPHLQEDNVIPRVSSANFPDNLSRTSNKTKSSSSTKETSPERSNSDDVENLKPNAGGNTHASGNDPKNLSINLKSNDYNQASGSMPNSQLSPNMSMGMNSPGGGFQTYNKQINQNSSNPNSRPNTVGTNFNNNNNNALNQNFKKSKNGNNNNMMGNRGNPYPPNNNKGTYIPPQGGIPTFTNQKFQTKQQPPQSRGGFHGEEVGMYIPSMPNINNMNPMTMNNLNTINSMPHLNTSSMQSNKPMYNQPMQQPGTFLSPQIQQQKMMKFTYGPPSYPQEAEDAMEDQKGIPTNYMVKNNPQHFGNMINNDTRSYMNNFNNTNSIMINMSHPQQMEPITGPVFNFVNVNNTLKQNPVQSPKNAKFPNGFQMSGNSNITSLNNMPNLGQTRGANTVPNVDVLQKLQINPHDPNQRESIGMIADVETWKKQYFDVKKKYEDVIKENDKNVKELNALKTMVETLKKSDVKYKETIKGLEQKNENLRKELDDPSKISHSKSPKNSQKTDKISNTDPWPVVNLKPSNMDSCFRDYRPSQKNTDVLKTDDIAPLLHEEILHFEQWINQYNQEKKTLFDNLINYIKQAVNESIPNSECYIYGSFATGLSLPWSDIDVVIKPSNFAPNYSNSSYAINLLLESVEANIKKKGWVEETKAIKNTSVPVLKITCKKEYLFKKVDISIQDGRHNGLKCVDLVKEYLVTYSQLRPLVLALKYLLCILNFNDTYQGGLSSYGLILMIICLIQRPGPKQAASEPGNLGYLLLNFLYRYGIEYDYVTNFQVLAQKPSQSNDLMNFQMNFFGGMNFMIDQPSIFIQDPLNPQNNVGRSTFAILKIKNAFMSSYLAAHQSCQCEVHKTLGELVMADTVNDQGQGEFKRGVKNKECSSVFKKILNAYQTFENNC
jgi:non-canonical poly(A) RNA polymerase PAPD5/7